MKRFQPNKFAGRGLKPAGRMLLAIGLLAAFLVQTPAALAAAESVPLRELAKNGHFLLVRRSIIRRCKAILIIGTSWRGNTTCWCQKMI